MKQMSISLTYNYTSSFSFLLREIERERNLSLKEEEYFFRILLWQSLILNLTFLNGLLLYVFDKFVQDQNNGISIIW